MLRSISRDFQILTTLVILLSALLIGGIWAWIDYQELVQKSREMQAQLLQERKDLLYKRVHQAVQYIKFHRVSTEERLRENIRKRTYEACDIAAGLVSKYRGKLTPNELRNVVRDSLRHIRYNDGRGYFFAINVDGTVELFADKPDLEGKNLTSMQDSNGQFVVKDMLTLAANEGEGFYQYTWTKPGDERSDNVKIAFVKYLQGLDWVIGTGEYLEDVEQDLQRQALNSLAAVYNDPGGENYIFAGTWDGLSLSGPAAGKNMLHIQDANGLFLVKELIKKAEMGSGFVEYVMPKLDGKRPAPKLSYVAGLPEWRWYIGSGEYIDNIDKALAELKESFYEEAKQHSIYILFSACTALLLNFLIVRVFTFRLKAQVKCVVDFFHQATEEPSTINTSLLNHEEFTLIGSAANVMLEDRNTALAKLQASEVRFREIFETMPDPVVIARMKGSQIIDANQAFEQWSGIPRLEALDKSSFELGIWKEKEAYERFVDKLDADGSLNNFEADFVLKEGEVRTVLLSTRLLKVADVPARLTVFRDISTEKAAERALAEMNRMKSEFISTAAHELCTPLSAIMGYTDLLLNVEEFGGFSEEQQRDFLCEIYDRGEALDQIITDLLDISRIERGGLTTFNRQESDLLLILRKIVDHFRVSHPDHHYQLDLPESADDAVFSFDRHRIRQVFENLLSNAIKYTPRGKLINLKAQKQSGVWVVDVVDEGIGIKEDQLDKVFEKFFRADASETAVGGLGLGMSIVKQIVEGHGGKIELESEFGQGTRVKVSLPV